MNQDSDQSAPKAVSAAEVGRLLGSDPVAAEVRAREILKAQPQNADAALVLGAALRRQGKAAEAKAVLEPIVATQPDTAFAQLELGLTLALLKDHPAALGAIGRAIDLAPTFANAWCALARALPTPDGISDGSDASVAVESAAAAIQSRRYSEAEAPLRDLLERQPAFQPARLLYAVALLAQEKGHPALAAIDELVQCDAANTHYRELRASALYEIGEFRQAIAQYEELVADGRTRPGAWISYGRALRAIGRQEECVAAFWKAVEILPAYAAGYRTLATVKTIRFAPAVIDHLTNLLGRPGLLTATRAQLHFALAKALDDSERHAESFENYTKSNELQATGVSAAAERLVDLVRRTKAVFTPAFIRQRMGSGCESNAPIFVVGMPRSGSTLVQEILAAHSAIERTGELRDLNNLNIQLRADRPENRIPWRYPEVLGFFDPGQFRALGEEYLERTRPRRKSARPFFLDKLPENFLYTGLIHLILPNARIIDVRRHPLDCCVSCFTNYLPEGPQWLHNLHDLGRCYAGYVELMAHFDAVLPGRVHRVIYEQLVAEPESQVRRLLACLDLPFEEGCLRYYEKEQAIVTTSVEQARRPIYREAVDASGRFEASLAPLKSALGPVLGAYPGVPDFYPVLKTSYSLRLA